MCSCSATALKENLPAKANSMCAMSSSSGASGSSSSAMLLERMLGLIKAAHIADIEALLSEFGCDTETFNLDEKNMLLRTAVDLGLTEVVEILILMLGCDPSFNNNWAIVCASFPVFLPWRSDSSFFAGSRM
jgi:hypothetical protein